MQIDFHPAALLDLESSIAWYASQSERAARNLASSIDQPIEKIQTQPNRFAFVTDGFRGCSVNGFPFQIVFQSDSERIYVIAIAHAKRRPNFWVQRIT